MGWKLPVFESCFQALVEFQESMTGKFRSLLSRFGWDTDSWNDEWPRRKRFRLRNVYGVCRLRGYIVMKRKYCTRFFLCGEENCLSQVRIWSILFFQLCKVIKHESLDILWNLSFYLIIFLNQETPLFQLLQSEPLTRGEEVKLKSSMEDFRFTIQTFFFLLCSRRNKG